MGLILSLTQLLMAAALQPGVPGDWVALSHPPTEDQRSYCSFQFPSRRVFASGRGIGISALPPPADRRDPLPFALPAEVASGHFGDRLVYPGLDGWLVGFDDGEFGGGVWWLSNTGVEAIKLGDANVIAFIPGPRGVLVLTGLSHLGVSDGQLQVAAVGAGGVPTLQVLRELPGAPYAYDVPAPAQLVIGTTGGVVEVNESGTMRLLSESRDLPHPNSLVVSGDGRIYVGMQHYILMLVPHPGGYTETWLAPKECPELKYLGEQGRFRCSCER